MDPKSILEQLLSSGKEIVAKGRDLAEDKIGVPEDGEKRDAMLSGLGKGAAVGGVLALLLGTRRGRRLSGTAIKLGSLAAVGGIAFKTYQKWKTDGGSDDALNDYGTSVDQLLGVDANDRSMNMMKAMIAAAKADGHLDATEVTNIRKQVASMDLDDEFAKLVDTELDRPLDAKQIADLADSPAAAAEIYLTSLMVIDVDTTAEREYLDELAGHLNLPSQYIRELEAESVG